jgi:HPt (histidine-containing phosphotransfer) domain-containing protein
MDVQMPELDGLETTAAIRERERAAGGRLPIVALTAHAMKGDAERCLAAGMDAYLAKPLQPRELASALASVVGAAPPGPAPPEPVDLPRLLERVGGDRKALADLVRIFRADWPKQVARLREAVRENDAQALRAAAHALKGAVSNFATTGAAEAALRLQKMGEAGHLAGAEAAIERLKGEIEDLVASLRDAVRGGDAGASRPARTPRGRGAGRRATHRRAPPRRR